MTTAPELIWAAFGRPAPEGKTGGQYKFEPADGHCATCSAPLARGVPFDPRRGVKGIDNETFSGHGEYAKWGTHVCPACAWLYGDPKRTHRSILAVGDTAWWPTIAKPIEGRPRWRRILRKIVDAAPDTPMAGILTTDPKPRLWPRIKTASCGQPGLYIHVPEHDISAWHALDIRAVALSLAAVDAAVAAGATKTAALRGLWSVPALSDRLGIDAIARMEARLEPLRGRVELNVAVVIA